METEATECFNCGTALGPQDADIPEVEDFVCPMCGTSVSASMNQCPGCGEKFTPVEDDEDLQPAGDEVQEEIDDDILDDDFDDLEDDSDQEELVSETEYILDEEASDEPPAEEEDYEVYPEQEFCQGCDTELNEDGVCPMCSPPVQQEDASDGCPICSSANFTVESGDLVSCADCGNVYIRKEYGGAEESWKWKFWVGLIFIIIGDLGVALGSYVHNVVGWSPLGSMYLGYGWIDQSVGIIGIILFILGLILFAWSFKREREVQCPSCKVIVQEGQLTEIEMEEEEELPEDMAVETALEAIGEVVECPSCGAEVSMFDTSCATCGVLFEVEEGFEDEFEEDEDQEPAEPGMILSASEIDENEMIMESLELEGPEVNGESLEALDELESAIEDTPDEPMDAQTCPECGAIVGKGLDTCPGCGAAMTDEGGE